MSETANTANTANAVNTIKADESDWMTDFADRSENNADQKKKSEWMKFDKPGKYTVRLVGKGVRFLKYFMPFGKGHRVITHKDYKGEDPAWQAGFYPGETFAIHVIDRADGKLKIMEKGKTLFKCFAEYQKVNNVNPAGKNGPDFVITLEIPHGDKKQSKYSATAKNSPAVFTEAEIAMIKENLAPLRTIYQTTPLEKIKEMWNALPDSAKIPPKREKPESGSNSSNTQEEGAKTTPEPTPAPVKTVEQTPPPSMPEPVSNVEEDDLFGDDKDDSSF